MSHGKDAEKRTGQKALAAELTEYIHGAGGVKQAQAATKVFFEDLRSSLNRDDYVTAFENTDRLVRLKREEVLGKAIVDLALAAKATSTKSATS